MRDELAIATEERDEARAEAAELRSDLLRRLHEDLKDVTAKDIKRLLKEDEPRLEAVTRLTAENAELQRELNLANRQRHVVKCAGVP